MPVFFRILYTSGMRVSELRLTRIRDINLTEGYITVHEAKNHKERLINSGCGCWRMAEILSTVITNKIIAKLGYTSLLDYYLVVYEN